MKGNKQRKEVENKRKKTREGGREERREREGGREERGKDKRGRRRVNVCRWVGVLLALHATHHVVCMRVDWLFNTNT